MRSGHTTDKLQSTLTQMMMMRRPGLQMVVLVMICQMILVIQRSARSGRTGRKRADRKMCRGHGQQRRRLGRVGHVAAAARFGRQLGQAGRMRGQHWRRRMRGQSGQGIGQQQSSAAAAADKARGCSCCGRRRC